MIDIVDKQEFSPSDRMYRRAIFNTLIHFRPKYCLEIGTNYYYTSHVFSDYFKKYQPDGLLITTDIAKWVEKPVITNVHPFLVYPYDHKILERHGGLRVYKYDWHKVVCEYGDNVVELNISNLQAKMNELGFDKFDMVFIDGDHFELSIKNDLYLAKQLTKDDGWIIIDDIEDPNHQQMEYYQKYLRPKNPSFYEYDNHQPKPGIALIQNKELTL